jgi:hypothetical protein
MSREAKIKIGATTNVKGPISGVIAQLKKLGSVTKKVSAGMRKLGAGIGNSMRAAAVSIGIAVAAGTVLVKLYTKQQDAEGRLVDALKLTGDATDANIDKFKKFASSIQKATVHGDEAVLELVVLAKAMGITTDKAEDATKAAIGLAARYKIDVSSAMKLVAKASAGQTGELARYGIVLGSTLSPQEKFNALLMMGKASFSFAEKEAGRLAGRFAQFKNSLGDVGEKFGLLVVKSLNLEKRFLSIRDALDAFIDRMDRDNSIERWAKQAEEKLSVVASIMKDIFGGSKKRSKAFEDIGTGLKFLFMDAATAAGKVLVAIAPIIGDMIGEAARNAIFGGKDKRAAMAQAEKEVGFGAQAGGRFDVGSQDRAAAVRARAQELLPGIRAKRLAAMGDKGQAALGEGSRFLAFAEKLAKERVGGGIGQPDAPFTGTRRAEDDRTRFTRLADERKAAKAKVQMEKFGMARFAKETTNFLFGKKKDSRKFQPEMLGRGVRRRAESPLDGQAEGANVGGLRRRQLKGIQRGKLLLNAGIRLEKKEAEGVKGIEERRGIGLGELFDMKQFGMTKTTGELGEKNNPMHVVLDEAPV